MTRPPGLRDHLRHIIDLPLRTSIRAKSLLRQFACTLVFAVAQEFDDAAFVGCEAVSGQCVIFRYVYDASMEECDKLDEESGEREKC